MPVVEYVSFPATDAYIADRTIVRSAFDKILKTSGCISVWQGIQDEDGKTGQWVIVWESYEAHKVLMDSTEYPDLLADLKPAIAGDINLQHVPYDSDLLNILSAPVTEIAVLHLNPTATKEEFVPVFNRLAEAIDKEEDSFPPSVFGESLENKGTFFTAIGWRSRAVHEKIVEAELYQKIITEIKTMVHGALTHTALTRHLL